MKVLKKPSSAVQLRTELASLKEELQKISITVRKTAPEATTQFTVSSCSMVQETLNYVIISFLALVLAPDPKPT